MLLSGLIGGKSSANFTYFSTHPDRPIESLNKTSNYLGNNVQILFSRCGFRLFPSVILWTCTGPFPAFGVHQREQKRRCNARYPLIGFWKAGWWSCCIFTDSQQWDCKRIFIQDSVLSHFVTQTAANVDKKGFRYIKWIDSSSSPDINPIGNVWCIIKRIVYENRNVIYAKNVSGKP